VTSEAQAAGLTEDEILTTVVILLGAGHETTTNLIGNAVLALLRQPSERARLAADPSLLPSALEASRRFDSPVQATSRTLPEPILCCTAARSWQAARSACCSAPRSATPRSSRRPSASRRGPRREPPLRSGHGIPFCIGAGLARLRALCADPGTLARRPGFLLRGLETLPVRF